MCRQENDAAPDCRALREEPDGCFHGRLAGLAPAALEARAAHRDACSSATSARDVLSCRELVLCLDAFVARELAPARRELCERHLSLCLDCRRYLDSYEKAIELGRRAMGACEEREPEIPPELVRAILTAR